MNNDIFIWSNNFVPMGGFGGQSIYCARKIAADFSVMEFLQIVDGQCTWVRFNSSANLTVDELKPFIVLPWGFSEQFLKLFSKMLNENGIKPESDIKLSGILEAQKSHLEDMRKLVFKGE